jgi:hypothetical protein
MFTASNDDRRPIQQSIKVWYFRQPRRLAVFSTQLFDLAAVYQSRFTFFQKDFAGSGDPSERWLLQELRHRCRRV